jgi:D-alanyl-D-alanine carboxypeptidase
MTKRLVATVALSLAAVLSGGAAAAAPPTPLQREADALRATGVSGVLARLEGAGGVEIARSGVADLDSGRPVPPDPYLRIGSLTKTYVAVVVLQLAGEGRLSLSDPVERWLPGVVRGNGNDGRSITVRQLLQHTSGLYDYSYDLVSRYTTPEGYRRERGRTYQPEELVAIALRHAPGTGWSYSNTNYVLAGMLIKAVTGHDWEREVHRRIITPLGLRHTITPGTWPFLPEPHATNYHQFAPGGPLVDTTVAIRALDSGADGSMVSTAADTNRFLGALVGGWLLAPGQMAEMRRLVEVPAEAGYPPGTADGLGLFHIPLSCGGGYWRHGGNGFGYNMEAAATDDGRRLTVSLFTHTFDPDVAVPRQDALWELVDHAFCRTPG